ncbi:asparagine synthase (glutamine-hydrolyzing) [Streptomyces sp. DSM 41527]|uniref:asparagine synthase (glutamine-hydrolyzing) n=1 Tax=Streptomyces mooreae TaxID=3075523 RepID=A0ABU2T3N5_9ACTN|nr:asparagine synthase (glutamine-hydrolyzing) [Streptomyces sp. DSM 41527]MDT0455680.1 asparagine synthase (glutamine-hydrolyzing) [Streptomyces sp. DSM 41527]
MCGLSGIARVDGRALTGAADSQLQRMVQAIAHRGPDGEAYYRSGPLGFGFVRLSLVDVAGGDQPLRTEDDDLVLIANGEIYNHEELAATLPSGTRLRTRSDCEVLLHLYRRDGLRFLDKVRGMFSLALYDRTRGRLLLARDRFGIKPVFYHQNAERVVFGSEVKALFEDPDCPRELDWERALRDQAMTRAPAFDESPAHSWFKGIELAPAGCVVSFDLRSGERSTHRYWSFPEFDASGDASEEELVRRYGELLSSAVADCEMADVEIGLFLSGGIDSAAVAALASGKPQTFTALNGSTLANGDSEWGHRTARNLGLTNHQILFRTDSVPGVEEWKRFLWLMQTPLAGPEAFYKHEMYRYVRDRTPHIKAMLLGGGADEFNGGYSKGIAGGGEWPDFLDNLDRMAVRRDQYRSPELGGWWDVPGLPLVKSSVLREAAGRPAHEPYEALFRWKYRDVQQYNCWHEDRSAAGNGIEARVPFLDHRLIELVAAVPGALRPRLIWDKQILRRSLVGHLPDELVHRPKGPFFYGEGVRHTYRAFGAMLAQDGGRLLEEALSGPGARQFLDADNLRATLRQLQANPSSGHVEFLLSAVNLGLLEQMAVSLPAPHVQVAKAPVPQSVPVNDWDTDAEKIEAEVVRRPPVDPRTRAAVADNVLLLKDPAEPSVWYLTIDGEIEYVLDEDELPEWPAVLRALDGERTIGEVLDGLGHSLETVHEELADAIDLGIVVRAEAAP